MKLILKKIFSIGVNLDISEEKNIIIKGIWGNSPADKAKIKVGDIIFSFNGQESTRTNLVELINIMEDDNIESIIFELKNSETIRKVKIDKAILF